MYNSEKFIFYNLPKTTPSQSLNNGTKIKKVWENLSNFFDNCTTKKNIFNQGVGVTLTAYTAYENDENPERADEIIDVTKKIFGNGKTTIQMRSQNGHQCYKTEWKLSNVDFEKALEYLLNNDQSWPKYTFGPVQLLTAFNFKFIDPETKIALPNQEHDSDIMIWLSKNSTCSAGLKFPFEEIDDFEIYFKKIEKYLPFKFNRKHLRIAELNKAKTNYSLKKLS